MIEAEIKNILAGPDYFTCKIYSVTMARANCLKRQKNAAGWNNVKGSKTGVGEFYSKPGAADPNCFNCKQGKKIRKNFERKKRKKEANPMEGFEIYKKAKQINIAEPRIYTSKNQKIYFNSAATRLYNIDKFKGVHLYFNKAKKVIGIELTTKEGTGFFLKLVWSSKYCSGFNAAAFFKQNKIKPFGQIPLAKSDLAENFYTAELNG